MPALLGSFVAEHRPQVRETRRSSLAHHAPVHRRAHATAGSLGTKDGVFLVFILAPRVSGMGTGRVVRCHTEKLFGNHIAGLAQGPLEQLPALAPKSFGIG